ncbi:hypothetical protein M1M07_23895 [Rhodococcus sp. HM1]|uniref:hypothetical protein n=1 Tax=Rhodococcus sp. HM1 TaxID=2937759 RepID=UPI00200AB19E|nr:hypothetical protein [Rhodococcus sp. HM1]MCK8674141.1 hypothetical protein [Rhodococcus sp. HM1]
MTLYPREAELITVNAKHPLGALIEQAKKANGWSDIDVANRAKARGHVLSKSNVARIRNDEVTTLVGKQLHALSAGLGVSVQQLAAAGLESMGIPGYIASATDAEQAVRMDPSLPEHVRRTLITIIRNERDRSLGDDHGAGTEEEQESRAQAGSTVDSGKAGADRGRPGAPIKRGKATRLNRKTQGTDLDPSSGPGAVSVAGNQMPPPDQLRPDEILAAHTSDDPSGVYPDDTSS